MNLLQNPELKAPKGEVPAGWHLWSPREGLAPRVLADGEHLALTGTGRQSCFGKLSQETPARAGQWYEAAVTFRVAGIEDITLCSLFNLVFRKDGCLVRECLLDEVALDGEWLTVRKTLLCPEGADAAELEIFFRHATQGALIVRHASVQEALPPPAPRTAKVATVKLWPAQPTTPERNREAFCELLIQAGQAGADICCLPEATNMVGTGKSAQDVAEPIEGPSFAAYAAQAKQQEMWVVACYDTIEDDLCRNTAVLIDRQGKLAGVYHKTHLHWPEYREGVTPGDDYPVFETDFGTIGMMICYDSWFPEVARLLTYKGAEAIFFPVWGYDEIVLRGRAVDNNVFIVAASLGSAASVISSNGDMIARTQSDGIITAEIAIEERPTCSYVDREITNGIPGATRWTRDTVSLREYTELREQILRV